MDRNLGDKYGRILIMAIWWI